jgi:hypothetical protein
MSIDLDYFFGNYEHWLSFLDLNRKSHEACDATNHFQAALALTRLGALESAKVAFTKAASTSPVGDAFPRACARMVDKIQHNSI